MLQTIEATYDPKQGLIFSETVVIERTVKVLVTFVESVPIKPSPKKGSAPGLLAALKAHPLPLSAQVTDTEIEAQIQESVNVSKGIV
ncbi:hypothetical protein TI05_02115 [Achromatium sp. WMS3]|nr:hypothetical protein TI05_02115 [Achromatium sp. WMS3]